MATINPLIVSDNWDISIWKINSNIDNLNTSKLESSEYTASDVKTKYESVANAYTDAEKTKLAWIATWSEENTINSWDNVSLLVNNAWYLTSAPVDSVAWKTWDVLLNKVDVWLWDIDNTADADKPVSDSTKTVLDTKITDAPADWNQYARKDASWTQVEAVSWWHTIEDEWVALNQRTNLNFVWNAVTVTDDSENDTSTVTIDVSWEPLPEYTVTNVTEDRVIDVNNYTSDEIWDLLWTLIWDINSGLVWPAWPQWVIWNWIESVVLFSTVWLVKTYRVTFTDSTTFDYEVSDWEVWNNWEWVPIWWTAWQILAKIDWTDFNTEWVEDAWWNVDSVNWETWAVTLTTWDLIEDTDKNYTTDAEKVVIWNTSGVNTWDQDLSWLVTNTIADNTSDAIAWAFDWDSEWVLFWGSILTDMDTFTITKWRVRFINWWVIHTTGFKQDNFNWSVSKDIYIDISWVWAYEETIVDNWDAEPAAWTDSTRLHKVECDWDWNIVAITDKRVKVWVLTPSDINLLVPSDTTWVSWADAITNMMSLTQAEYDAITPDTSTFYIITD